MKEYDKEKLHEYAKELFALCLEKGLYFEYNESKVGVMIGFKKDVEYIGNSYITETLFKLKDSDWFLPIWELIEKVKAL